MNFTLFNRYAIAIVTGRWYRHYAITPYIEYTRTSFGEYEDDYKNIYFCFWCWHLVISITRIEKGGHE